MSLPLEGIKVLDVTQFAPGQYVTMVLGDFGADVIRIERNPDNRAGPSGKNLKNGTMIEWPRWRMRFTTEIKEA
jgi:crotonobetainyl-CoA:carnitine CoA-transferase CaiB-like acyl-CoA transferase